MIGNYMTDKHGLIHLSSCPPMLDERLAKWVEKAMPLAVCLHGLFGAGTYQSFGSTFLMGTISGFCVALIIFFECWEACKDEEPPQDINMGVPYQHFWMHGAYVHVLLRYLPALCPSLACRLVSSLPAWRAGLQAGRGMPAHLPPRH